MRRTLSFSCDAAQLIATLDEGASPSGLLIVSGGNEIRIGAHRGMAKLAATIAEAGHPVFRFDRRGVGDSEGENNGFEASAPDIAAAVEAFRATCPGLKRIVAFGNCDAATALLLHRIPCIEALVLANPWVIEQADELPPPATIRARYAERLRDPASWHRLLSGGIDLRKLAAGVLRLLKPVAPTTLPARFAAGLTCFEGPVTILAAKRDGTAVAFLDAWKNKAFDNVRRRHDVTMSVFDSPAHSFAAEADFARLVDVLRDSLRA